MRLLTRIVAVLFLLIAAFLVYAIIAAVTSDEGARVGVCILYAVIAAVLAYAASWLWKRPAGTADPAV